MKFSHFQIVSYKCGDCIRFSTSVWNKGKMTKFHFELISRISKIFSWFFVQMKAEYSYFTNQKFFTPLTSFLPPLFSLENSLWSDKSSNKKRVGKKLVRGVKNFWFVKYEYSAFICTKNQQKIFRTHWNHSNCADPWVGYVLEHLL